MCTNPKSIRLAKTKGERPLKLTQRTRSKSWREQYELTRKQYKRVTVSCGKCAECETQKRTEWSFRLKWEQKDHTYTWFVMLTYATEHLRFHDRKGNIYSRPVLYKKDLQDFLKRLRARQNYLQKKGVINSEHQIRYFAVGEYGDEKHRPHYHLILFGLHPIVRDELHNGNIWAKGFAKPRPFDGNPKGFYYLTKYVFKQQNSELYNKEISPFLIMSRKPHIGQRFTRLALKSMANENEYLMVTKGLKRNHQIPKTIRKKLSKIKQEIANIQYLKEADLLEQRKVKEFTDKELNYFSQKQQMRKRKQQKFELEKITP